MASGDYSIHRMPQTFSPYDSRRHSGSFSGVYDRPPIGIGPRRSPSPSPTRRATYDAYSPHRPLPSYRDDVPASYRPPNVYRSDYPPSTIYPRSPSPDRYSTLTHSADAEGWDRQSAWPPSSSFSKPTGWTDRKPAPPSPTTSVRSRGQGPRDVILAKRMFEPSENWKQSHTDRPGRSEGPSFGFDRYGEQSRGFQDFSPDPLLRSAPRPSIPPGGDRYRPKSNSIGTRSDTDGYRFEREPPRHPAYPPEPRPLPPIRREPPAGNRPWDHYEPLPPSPSKFSSRAASPDWRSSDYVAPPMQPELSARRYDSDSRPSRMGLSRRSSRSSIASSHVSDLPSQPGKGHSSGHSVDSSMHTRFPSEPNAQTQSAHSSPRPDITRGFMGLPSKPNIILVTDNAQGTKPPGLTGLQVDEPSANGRIPGLASSSFTFEFRPPTRPKYESEAPTPGVIPSSSAHNGVNPSQSEAVIAPKQSPEVVQVNSATAPLKEDVDQIMLSPKDACDKTKSPSPKPPSASSATSSGPVDATASNSNVEPSSGEPMLQATPTSLTPSEIFDSLLPSDSVESKALGLEVTQPPSLTPFTPPLSEMEVAESEEAVGDTSKVLLELKPLFAWHESPTLEGAPAEPSFADALRAQMAAREDEPEKLKTVIDHVLLCNQATAIMNVDVLQMEEDATPEALIQEVMEGPQHEERMREHESNWTSLAEHFEQRQALIKEKAERLSREYLELHRKWRARCAALNEQQRHILSAEQENLHLSGRTTRRTTAITDAVRSDLEMEQIIASLGNDDAMDPNYLSMKNAATIPDMISVTHGKVDYVFDDTNHLVENPAEYYAPHTGIHDWTEEEMRVFIDRFAQYPKQFGIISEALPHKTSKQCVDYYYLHKKRQIDFRKVVSQLGPKKRRGRRGGGKKKGNALLTDIAQHDAEVGKNLSSFVVPSRVGKAKRGGGRARAQAQKSATPMDSGPATPQPEPRSARLKEAALAAEAAQANAATPEPDVRPKRGRKSVAGSTTAVPTPLSMSVSAAPPETPADDDEAMDVSEVASMAFSSSVPTPVQRPLSPVSRGDHEGVPMQIALANSGSSSTNAKQDDVDGMQDDSKTVKKTKRSRKQVKSVAIIDDEPPSPPAESALTTPVETSGPESSSVLTKATKILSDIEARQKKVVEAEGGGSRKKEKEKGKTSTVPAKRKSEGATSSVPSKRPAKAVEKSAAKAGESSKPPASTSAKGKATASTKSATSANATEAAEVKLDGEWPDDEKNLFLLAFTYYGLDFKMIAVEMRNTGKSLADVEAFYRLNKPKLDLDKLRQGKDMRASHTSAYSPPMASLDYEGSNGKGGSTSRSPFPNYPAAVPFKPHLQAMRDREEHAPTPPMGLSAGPSYPATPYGAPTPYTHHPYLAVPTPYGYAPHPQHYVPHPQHYAQGLYPAVVGAYSGMGQQSSASSGGEAQVGMGYKPTVYADPDGSPSGPVSRTGSPGGGEKGK